MDDGIFDLVLHRRGNPDSSYPAHPAPTARIDLAPGICIVPLSRNHADTIFSITEPNTILAGQVHTPIRAWTHWYAVSRSVAQWDVGLDDDRRIGEVLALSRLVHPTSISFQHACRARFEADRIIDLNPFNPVSVGRGAWVIDPSSRSYLSVEEWASVARLMALQPFEVQSTRWRRSMWMFEYASRTRDAHVRWTLAVTAMEALVHTDRFKSTQQFTRRTVALAEMLGVAGWTDAVAHAAYDFRSSVSHGQWAPSPNAAAEHQAAALLEPLLRAALRHAVQDVQFGDLLRDDARLRLLS